MATYYIKNGGNDSNSGLSDALAWVTVSKVNSFSFSPGDQILFKRGNVWYEQLSITESGSAGNPITVGAYDSGAKPIFTGMINLPGWTVSGNWYQYTTNVWRISWTRSDYRNRLWINGTERKEAQYLANVNSDTQWFWESNLLYVYSTSNPAIAFSSMECVTDSTWYNASNGNNYITVQNIDVRGYRNIFLLPGCDYWIIENCNLAWNFIIFAVGISNGVAGSYGCIIRNNIFDSGDRLQDNWQSENNEDFINIRAGVYNLEVYGNSFFNIGHTAIYVWGYPISSTNNIQNIKIHDNYFNNLDVDYGRAFGVDFANLTQGSGIEIYNNLIEDQAVHSQIQGNDIKLYNNIFNRCRGKSYDYYHPDGNALMISAYWSMPQNMKIYNNVFANCEGAGLVMHGDYPRDISYNIIANNIFYNNKGWIVDQYYNPPSYTNAQIFIENYTTTNNNTFRNNLFYRTGVTNCIYYRGSMMSVATFNVSDAQGDNILDNISGTSLTFVNELNNFHLQSGSPADGMGYSPTLSSYDYDDVLWDSPPSIGAYEYVGGGYTPYTLPFTENFNTSSLPINWTTQNIGTGITQRWSVSNSTNAGGSVYEMHCLWQIINPGTTRLITPAINTVGITYSLDLSFRSFIDDYGPGATLRIQSSTDSVNWINEAWYYSTVADTTVGPSIINTTIVYNLNSSMTYIAFVITGDLYQFDHWYIDNIYINSTEEPPAGDMIIINSANLAKYSVI